MTTKLNIGVLLVFFIALSLSVTATDPLNLKLPANSVNMDVKTGSNTYVSVKLWNVGTGYDVSDGTYNGWCADPDTLIYAYTTYSPKLYSSYDNDLPDYIKTDDWDRINYIVNQYKKGSYSCASKSEVQTAIWNYIQNKNHNLSYYAQDQFGTVDWDCVNTIISDANNNGNGFVPGAGDVVGVVADNGEQVQVIFFEIPYLAPEAIELIAAIAMVSPAFGYLLIKKRN